MRIIAGLAATAVGAVVAIGPLENAANELFVGDRTAEYVPPQPPQHEDQAGLIDQLQQAGRPNK
jgi:hypothetical protein